MNLTDIENPAFLKTLNIKQMEDLSAQIRSFLIEHVAETGGHLSSNLGTVELSIALHYVFNSPEDRIIFDVGHQSYTHKILTGRAERFSSLRQFHGLSGFQKRKESCHDLWEAGHSSTSLSAALGMAVARDLNGDHYDILPVIGDGALSSGIALEALNEIGIEKRKIIIIFNDNGMSISRNVGALTKGFSQLRISQSYINAKDSTKNFLRKNAAGKKIYSALKSVKDAFKSTVIDGGVFHDFNIDYIGPVDGHNIKELINTFHAAKRHDGGPIVVHVITKKGKGFAPCENDKEGLWHSVGPFDPSTGNFKHAVPTGYDYWSGLMCDNLCRMAEKNKDIVMLTPAMINGSHLQKFFALYPERSFDCGIAEEHAATFAAGLAISGKRPYLCVYASFLQRCYDQINHDICRMDLPVVIGIDHAGLAGDDGETHHGIFDIGILSPIPNLILAQPSDAKEAGDLLKSAFAQSHPFAIRFPKGIVKKSDEDPAVIKIGSWIKGHERKGNKVWVLTYGENYPKILNRVINNDMPVTVVNCRFFKPLDTAVIEEIALSEKPVVTFESDMLTGGLGSLIINYCCNEGIHLQKMRRIGIDDQYIQQGSEDQLRKELHIDINELFAVLEKEIDGQKK